MEQSASNKQLMKYLNARKEQLQTELFSQTASNLNMNKLLSST